MPTTVLLIAAHPDDEVIGAGSKLSSLPNLTIAHVTDGAPRNMYDAARYGFASSADYTTARRAEFTAALHILNASHSRCLQLGFSDQEAAWRLVDLTQAIERLIRQVRPDVILTHAYEGGHPDHDACAFAVHAANRQLNGPDIFEFACYHAGHDGIETGSFLDVGQDFILRPVFNRPSCFPNSVTTIKLTPTVQAAKQRAFACFKTQRDTLALFRTDVERFRPAPLYDFRDAPHPGTLYYERFDWGINGAQFRKQAALAARHLRVEEQRF